MVLKLADSMQIKWLACVPDSIGSGVESSLLKLALRFCLKHTSSITVSFDSEYLRQH